MAQIMWGPHPCINIGAECRRKKQASFSENTTRNTRYRANREEKISQ